MDRSLVNVSDRKCQAGYQTADLQFEKHKTNSSHWVVIFPPISDSVTHNDSVLLDSGSLIVSFFFTKYAGHIGKPFKRYTLCKFQV